MSSKQESSRAGPERIALFKHKSGVKFTDMLNAHHTEFILCCLINSVAVKNSPIYSQCRPVLVSSKKDSGRAGPERGVLYKHISRIFGMLLESHSIKCHLLNSVACVGLTYLYAV